MIVQSSKPAVSAFGLNRRLISATPAGVVLAIAMRTSDQSFRAMRVT